MFKSLIVLLLISLVISTDLYKLYLLPTKRGARCLDGSPTGVYIHEGSGKNANKFMVYMNGGGFCNGFTLEESLEACYIRSKKDIGTTNVAPPERSFKGFGILSTDSSQNPVFYDWTKAYFIYCDGTEYTGTLTDPISYKDTKLYFRGLNNTFEQFRFLDEHYDFYNGQTIVLTGQSAGGMGTFFYSNYLFENTKKAQVLSIPDSGVFLVDYFSTLAGGTIMREAAQTLMTLVNSEINAFPITQCGIDNKEDILECYTTSNLTQYLKAPMLIIQSPYDSFSIKNIIIANCPSHGAPYTLENCNETTRQSIQDYRQKMIFSLKQLKGKRNDVGVWSPSCSQHCFTGSKTFTDGNFRVPSGTGKTVSQTIQEFIDNPDQAPWYLDEVPWPFNKGCNGIIASKLQTQK